MLDLNELLPAIKMLDNIIIFNDNISDKFLYLSYKEWPIYIRLEEQDNVIFNINSNPYIGCFDTEIIRKCETIDDMMNIIKYIQTIIDTKIIQMLLIKEIPVHVAKLLAPFIETKNIELYLLFYDDLQEIILTTNHEFPVNLWLAPQIAGDHMTFNDMEWALHYTVSPGMRCVFFGENALQILYTDLNNKLPLPKIIKTTEL